MSTYTEARDLRLRPGVALFRLWHVSRDQNETAYKVTVPDAR